MGRGVNIRRFLTFFFAALCLGLAFAPFPFRFCAFFALTPLFWVIEKGRKVFFWGWLFGFFAAGFHLWWLWFLIVPVQPITRLLLNLGVVLLFGYLGLYFGLFTILVRRFGLWSAPLVLPLLEFARSQTQIAFPWDLLGYTMTAYTPFIQPAALGGVYLVSAWVVLVNLLIYQLLFSRQRIGYLAGLVAAFLIPFGYAWLHQKPLVPGYKVAIIQPNVSPLDKGDWDSRERIQADLVQLTREAAKDTPTLVIYPETATLVDVLHSTTMGPALRTLAESLNIEIFTGTPIYDDDHRTWHNGAVLIRPGTERVQRYYKMRLVPFSEKIPYVDELPILRKLIGTADMGNWDRGWNYTVFESRIGRLSGLICFEAIFPDLAREFCHRGSRLLVVVTNDGWFGTLPGAYQHAELAVMRTVENGVPLVRSANNGISFIIDPYGRVQKKSRLFTQEVLVGEFPQALSSTLYRRFGDLLLLIYPAGIVLGLILRRSLGRRGH